MTLRNNPFKALLCFILCITGCKTTDNNSPNEDVDLVQLVIREFEAGIKKDIQDDGINGSISAAIVRKNKLIWSKAFGVADLDKKTAADTNTIYRTASISKPFTAFLMMQLYQKGVIDIDDPIEKYLPEVRNLKGYSDSTKITFRQIASHTSGLQREPTMKGADEGPIEKWEEKILEAIPLTSFKSKPGKKHSYSNIGYGLMGLALSRAASKSFLKLVRDEIFVPLKMNNSFFIVPDSLFPKLAKGIDGGPIGKLSFERPTRGHKGRGYKVPNGGIYSTPADLGKFMRCNLGYCDLLKKENLELMQTITHPKEETWDRGLGFVLYQDDVLNTVEHSGFISGYTAYFIFDKKHQYGVIIMRNYNFGSTNPLELTAKVLLRKLIKAENKN